MASSAPSPRDSVERYAAMSAALRQPFVDREAILGDGAVTENEWRQVEIDWREQIPQHGDLASRYQVAFKRANEALRQGADPRVVATDVPALAPPAEPAPPAAPTVPVAQPTAAPPVVPMAPPVVVVSPPAIDPLDVTAPPQAQLGPVLPFGGTAPAPPRAQLDAGGDQSGETTELRVEHLFGSTPPEHNEPIPAARAATAAMPVFTEAPPTPFDPNADSSPPPVLHLEPHEQVGETGFVPALVIDDPLPFEAAVDDRMNHRFTSAPLTLSQLAAVFVELQHAPRREVLARYHLTEEQLRLVESERRALPSHDARFVGAWDAACQTYRKWRQSQGQ